MMRLSNRYITEPMVVNWEETAEGFLRCHGRILKSMIMPYDVSEFDSVPEGCPNPIKMFVPMDSMTDPESLRSLEGVPVVAWEHKWITDGMVVKEASRGNSAGAASVIGPYIEIDLLITDPQTIQDIKDGKIGEISSAYNADSVFEKGSHDGVEYDAKQTHIRYNHIAIIPVGRGRAGSDVRIMNEKNTKGDNQMERIFKVKLRNGKTINTDEEGATAVAEDKEATSEGEGATGKKLEDLMKELEEVKASKVEIESQMEELKGELSVYKEKLDQLLAEETIEHAAMGINEEQAEAGEILENSRVMDEKGEEVKEEEKKKVMNSSRKLYGANLHKLVLTSIGVKCENMSPEALRGAFKAQHQIVKTISSKRTVAGARVFNGIPQETSANPSERNPKQRLGFPEKK